MVADTGTLIAIREDTDVVAARQSGRAMAARIGMSPSEQTMVATAISEIARNIVVYADAGEILVTVVDRDGRLGLEVVGRDQGPGIADVDQALQDGFSTTHSLGLGLPGARRLMDDFVIDSRPGAGTTVTMRKWVT